MKPTVRRALIAATVVIVLLLFGVASFHQVVRRNYTEFTVRNLSSALKRYREEIGLLDTLDNHQIVGRLDGTDNPKHQEIFSIGPHSYTFTDGWGHDFRFVRCAAGDVTVWSAGPNGVFEDSPGSDDIRVE